MDATGETFTLANHYAKLEFDAIPADVRAEAKRLLLDTLGCVISATGTPEGRMVSQVGADMGAGKIPDGADYAGRSYEMGRLANLMDFDEGYAYCHFGAAAVAAALTMARWRHLPGKELVTALVAGYELGGQVALGIGPEFKVRDGKALGRLDVWGITAPPVFAAVGSAARALGLSAQQTNQAYAVAASNMPIPIGGKWSTEVDLPNTKYGDLGWCAMTGVLGAVSALRGTTAVPTILDGEKGLIRIVQGGENDSRRFLARLGERWHLRRIFYKRWPVCGWIQYPLAALDVLMKKHGIRAEDVSDVVVEVAMGAVIPRFTNTQPKGFVSLQFSIPHAMAMLLMRVSPGPQWLSAELSETSAVKAMRDRIRVEGFKAPQSYAWADPFSGGDAEQNVPSAVRVTTARGTFREESNFIFSENRHPQVPIEDSQVEAKFRGLVAAPHAERLISLVRNIEQLDDAARLLDAVNAASPADPEYHRR
jgi:2-methylcitrate dehydratase PrpD